MSSPNAFLKKGTALMSVVKSAAQQYRAPRRGAFEICRAQMETGPDDVGHQVLIAAWLPHVRVPSVDTWAARYRPRQNASACVDGCAALNAGSSAAASAIATQVW